MHYILILKIIAHEKVRKPMIWTKTTKGLRR